MRPAWCVSGLAAVAVVLAGCTQTVGGTARLDHTPIASTVGDVLLSEADVNAIMGTSGLEVVSSTQDLTDSSADVSDVACVGALYHGEALVYADSGWADLVDEILTEPDNYGEHWVEQTAVRFPTPQRAAAFLEEAKADWTGCAGKPITIEDDPDEFVFRFADATVDGVSVSLTAYQQDGDGWSCRHVLRAAAALIIEVSTCGESSNPEAATIAERIAGNAQ